MYFFVVYLTILLAGRWATSTTLSVDFRHLDPLASLASHVSEVKRGFCFNTFKKTCTDEEQEQAVAEALKSVDETTALVAEAIQLADLIHYLEFSDPEVLLLIRRILTMALDNTLLVSASNKLTIENIRLKIFEGRESESPLTILQAKCGDELNSLLLMCSFTERVIGDASLGDETRVIFSENPLSDTDVSNLESVKLFRSSAIALADLRNSDALKASEIYHVQAIMTDLKKLVPGIRQGYLRAQKVMAIRRLKIARWVYLGGSGSLLLLSPISLLLKRTDVRIFFFAGFAWISFMSCMASLLCFRRYEHVIHELEEGAVSAVI